MIIPEEGIGWEMQVVAIMKGTDNLPDAKRLMDWTLGRGMELFGERQSIIADNSKVTKDPELPDFYDEVADMEREKPNDDEDLFFPATLHTRQSVFSYRLVNAREF